MSQINDVLSDEAQAMLQILEQEDAEILRLEERKVTALERIAVLMVDVVDELRDANGFRRNRE